MLAPCHGPVGAAAPVQHAQACWVTQKRSFNISADRCTAALAGCNNFNTMCVAGSKVCVRGFCQ
jgi:hypothetical protein